MLMKTFFREVISSVNKSHYYFCFVYSLATVFVPHLGGSTVYENACDKILWTFVATTLNTSNFLKVIRYTENIWKRLKTLFSMKNVKIFKEKRAEVENKYKHV